MCIVVLARKTYNTSVSVEDRVAPDSTQAVDTSDVVDCRPLGRQEEVHEASSAAAEQVVLPSVAAQVTVVEAAGAPPAAPAPTIPFPRAPG